MFRFTIRDLLWLMVVVGLECAWTVDKWQQNKGMQGLTDIAGIKTISLFPRNWEGITAAIRNDNAILRFQVDALSRELQSRGHRVEIDGCNVFVDRTEFPFRVPPSQNADD